MSSLRNMMSSLEIWHQLQDYDVSILQKCVVILGSEFSFSQLFSEMRHYPHEWDIILRNIWRHPWICDVSVRCMISFLGMWHHPWTWWCHVSLSCITSASLSEMWRHVRSVSDVWRQRPSQKCDVTWGQSLMYVTSREVSLWCMTSACITSASLSEMWRHVRSVFDVCDVTWGQSLMYDVSIPLRNVTSVDLLPSNHQ